MKLYAYDESTKEYLYEFEAQLDPLESKQKGKNVYLISSNSTKKEPSFKKDGFAVCFDEATNKWIYKKDSRGKTLYHKKSKEATQVQALDFDYSEYTELKPNSEYSQWQGNQWVDVIPPEVRIKILADEFIKKVDEIMNYEAKKRGYDSIVTAVTYAGYPNEFQAEGIAFGTWRSAIYQWGYTLEEKFKSGELSIDSFSLEEVLKDMPKLNLKGLNDENQ